MNEPINQLFATAMVLNCSLADAAKYIGVSQEVLVDAVAYRMNHAVDRKVDDYQQSITECFRRLEEVN